jgi:TonB family protein
MKYPSTLIILCMIHIALMGQDQKKAEPYAGEQQLKQLICQEVVYPEEDLKAGTEGTVVLTFQIDSAGNMSGLQVKESVSPGLDKEALRLMSMSIWTPAYHLGKRITTFVDYPIKFNIKKYKKNCKKRGFEQAELPFTPVDTSYTVYNSEDVDAAPKPIFDDPDQSVNQFIMDNLKYPEDAFRQNISGTVVLSFIVETNGLISHIIAEEPLGGGCTQEAIRIIELLKWMPGIKNKQAVRTRSSMKITFKLADYQDLQYVPAGQNQGL